MPDRLNDISALCNADAVLLTSPENVRYATGFSGDSSQLLLTARGAFFFTDSRYTAQAGREVAGPDIVTTGGMERVGAIAAPLRKANAKKLAIEKTDVSVELLEQYRDAFGAMEYVDISMPLLRMRAVKTQGELKKIRKAAAANEVVLSELQNRIKPGMSELDVRAELVYQIMRQGMDSAFAPIVAAGKNSALPHAAPSGNQLKNGDFLTLDFGCRCEGYCSDITRTFGIGNIDEERKKIYDRVKAAHQAALDAAVAGKSAREVDAAARDLICENGYGEYFGHGTGHGVGLQIHELPVLNPASADQILPGMVYTIEPGIYIPGLGGVRIEDMCIAGEGSLYTVSKELILLQ